MSKKKNDRRNISPEEKFLKMFEFNGLVEKRIDLGFERQEMYQLVAMRFMRHKRLTEISAPKSILDKESAMIDEAIEKFKSVDEKLKYVIDKIHTMKEIYGFKDKYQELSKSKKVIFVTRH